MKYNHTEITEDFFYIILEIIITYNKQNDDLFTLAQYLYEIEYNSMICGYYFHCKLFNNFTDERLMQNTLREM